VTTALPGRPAPLGATPGPDGTNFAVASAADGVELCLFGDTGAESRIPLPERDGEVWHGFVPLVDSTNLVSPPSSCVAASVWLNEALARSRTARTPRG
jgi:pullulanase/glycogen debranching enzyme